MPIEIDRRGWPVVRVRFPAGAVRDDEFTAYLDALSALAERRARYATLTDLSALATPITTHQRALFDAWMERAEPRLAPFAAANAIVATTPLGRSVAHTVYWHWRSPPRHRVFASLARAERWCSARLAAARTPSAATSSRTPSPADAPAVPAIASTVDLFGEPAFLVDASGRVVFANRAARAAFPAPHGWVAAALAGSGPGADVDVRVVRVSSEADALRLVVVDDGAGLSGLPPSLRRVAARLRLGETDKEIAAATGLTVASVRTYVRRLYARIGVHGRRELMRTRRP